VDGAIVGSNLLRVLEESNYSVEAVEKYVSEFKQELNQ
jgi:tryptophan synthase alpha subunit